MQIALIDPSLFTLFYDRELAAGLEQAGHQVTLYGRRPGPDDGEASGVRLVEAFYRLAGSRPIAALPGRMRLAVKGLDHAWSMVRLVSTLRRVRPDVIHFQWLPLPMVDRHLLASLRRVAPLVLTVHDTNAFNGDPSSRLQARGFPESLACFDRLIVHTQQGEARLQAQGVPAGRIVIVPQGTTGPVRSSAPDPMAGEITFVLFGKIKPYKGTDILIRAFAALPEPLRAQARLRIVGKPYMDLAPLHALVQEHGLTARVSIEPGFIADDEVASVLAPGCVAVFPYREIESSAVLHQALAFGRPVIASRIGEFRELLDDGATGILTPCEDVEAFTAALARMLEDRAYAAGCSAHARLVSGETLRWDAVALRTAAVYAGLARETAVSDGRSRATEVSSKMRKITGGNC